MKFSSAIKSLFFIFLFPFFSQIYCLETTKAAEPPSSWQKEIYAIDQELENLNDSLKLYRQDALNIEMNTQNFMFDNWHQFAEGIKTNEKEEQHITALKKRINDLNERKQAIIKKHSTPP